MHRKGLHCGSTALGDALRAKGLDLPEELIFGLGAGLGFSLHQGDTSLAPPQARGFFVGRSASFERDLCQPLGAELREERFAGAEEAWLRIEELLAAGELPLVYTVPDWPRIARLSAQVIEVRGTGGGFFRRMYARFLEAAAPALAPLCERAAGAWTSFAANLDARHAACVQAETALWSRAIELCA